jgi:hypothetical protein
MLMVPIIMALLVAAVLMKMLLQHHLAAVDHDAQ